nr:hypothetical protein Itr_chr08CG11400 [Ipomoea trifida]GLL38123.1 hypothetical protein Itr_chr10CG20020 [Ipomoea trifida]
MSRNLYWSGTLPHLPDRLHVKLLHSRDGRHCWNRGHRRWRATVPSPAHAAGRSPDFARMRGRSRDDKEERDNGGMDRGRPVTAAAIYSRRLP